MPMGRVIGLGLLIAGTPFGGHYTDTRAPTAVQSAIVATQYVVGGLLSLMWYILVKSIIEGYL
jgi:hypothetical protein